MDGALHLPEGWRRDAVRCWAAGVPEEERSGGSRAAQVLALLQRARRAGHLNGQTVGASAAFSDDPTFRRTLWKATPLPAHTDEETFSAALAYPTGASRVHGWVGWHRAMTMQLLAGAFPLALSRGLGKGLSLPTERGRSPAPHRLGAGTRTESPVRQES